jgi:hypothetical protein
VIGVVVEGWTVVVSTMILSLMEPLLVMDVIRDFSAWSSLTCTSSLGNVH